MPDPERSQSAQVLSVHGRLFLIDCGEGTQVRLLRCGIPMMKLDSIFISHIHGDHLFGLFGLLATLGMKGRQIPLNIFAPPNFGPVLNFFLGYYGEGLSYEIRFTPLKMKAPEKILQAKSFEVLAFPLRHGIDTFGFMFREKEPSWNVRKEFIPRYGLTLTEIGTLKRGEDVVREDGTVISASEASYKPFEPRSFAYCSDTAVFPEEREWLKGVDLLYHEATYTEPFRDSAYARFHSVTTDVAALAAELGVKKLVIGHYSSRCRDISLYEKECRAVFPETVAASDGDVFEIEK